MENIDSPSLTNQSDNAPNESFWNLAKNFLLVVAIIIGLLLIIHIFTKNSNTNFEFANNLTTPQVTSPSVTQTKQTYKQFDEIKLPSSIGGEAGYIGRDFICFRDKISDQDFVSKRNGCMACQVDNKIHAKTGTNIIATCVYGENSTDPSVWTHAMCESECSKLVVG